jgi:hypothetical protein
MQRVSNREWRKKTEQPQINAVKDKTAKGHEWSHVCERVSTNRGEHRRLARREAATGNG